MTPDVTIGICIRNCENSIKEVIDSIQNQDFPHELMEVIFVDDGSTDRTLSIVSKCASSMDMRSKVFHDCWKGLGPARNVIVENANSDYIIWVDGDMTLPKDHVRKQVEFMKNNPKVGAAKAKYDIYPGESLVATLENAAFIAVDAKYGGTPTSRTLGTGGAVYRVDAIRQVGGFDDRITGTGEDMDAEHRIRKAGWLLYLGAPAKFYERRRKTWRGLWKEGFWHGYGVHYIVAKNNGIISIHKMTPFAGFLVGAYYSILSYRVLRRKIVFLLPIQYAFKRIAWCLGFAKGQMDAMRARTL